MSLPAPLLRAIALVVLLAAPAAAAVDPAVPALRARDAYVSPRALGGGAPEAEARLAEAARSIRGGGPPVKLAIVAGPVGAPSMRAYATRLRETLGTKGTLAVTAPSRPVVAVGPRSPAEVTRRLRAARVGRIEDPVERVIAAGRAAAPEPQPAGTNVRQIGALLGVAVLGGLWAVAIGLRRERRRAGDRTGERRRSLTVYADALGAQVDALGDAPVRGTAAATDVEVAREAHGVASRLLQDARDERRLALAESSLRRGLAAVARAREAAGDAGLDDPFAGLCAIDPAHGPAVERLARQGSDTAVCRDCAEAISRGRMLAPRLVSINGQPRPFSDMPRPAWASHVGREDMPESSG